MIGHFKGVQAIIRAAVGAPALYVHCVAHVLNLTLVHACNLSAIRNTLGTVCKVVDFFKSSPLPFRALNDAIAADGCTKREKVKTPCATRWVEKHEAVHTFYSVYIIIHFESIFHHAQLLQGDEIISLPRASAQLRNTCHANPDVSSPLVYYRVTVFNTFIVDLLQQLNDRFTMAKQTALLLSSLLPKYVTNASFE
jgi:hypothetical protein